VPDAALRAGQLYRPGHRLVSGHHFADYASGTCAGTFTFNRVRFATAVVAAAAIILVLRARRRYDPGRRATTRPDS